MQIWFVDFAVNASTGCLNISFIRCGRRWPMHGMAAIPNHRVEWLIICISSKYYPLAPTTIYGIHFHLRPHGTSSRSLCIPFHTSKFSAYRQQRTKTDRFVHKKKKKKKKEKTPNGSLRTCNFTNFHESLKVNIGSMLMSLCTARIRYTGMMYTKWKLSAYMYV